MMKKILDLLEQNVQWLVLTASLAFAGYITWTYVVNKPVVGLGGGTQTAASVDETILTGPAADLDTAMHKNGNQATITPPNFVQDFHDAMNYAKVAPTTAPVSDALVIWPQTPAFKFSDLPALTTGSSASPGGSPESLGAVGMGNITQLPKLPTPQIIATRSDLSYVAMPGQQPAQPLAPASDDTAPAPVPQQIPVVGMDRTWASVLYTIDAAALSKEWDAIHFPASSSMTVFVQVQLERQELKPDGSWSDPVALPPLAVGVNMPPVPESGKATSDALGFISWAKQHQAEILRPPFYKMLKGRQWAAPGLDVPVVQTEQKFDASKYLKAKPEELMKLTLEQRQMVQKAIADQKADAAKAHRGSGGNAGSGAAAAAPPADAGGGDDRGINDPDRPANYLVADPAAAANAGTPASPGARGTPQPRSSPSAAQTITQLVASAIPSGEFDPAKWPDDHPQQSLIVGWAHDETVQASHTYRYRVIYRLKNPLLGADSAVKDPALAKQFDLKSSPSEWSANVEVQSALDFWVVSASDTAGQASVDVFRRQGGDAKHKVFKVSAGDTIGGKDAAIDYVTGWTVVDMRKDPRTDKIYVLLMDPQGAIHRRDVESDAANPKYLELKQQSSSATASR